MPNLLLVLTAFAVGVLIALQPGINSQLARRLQAPLHAAVVSFLAGSAALVAASLATGAGLPRPRAVAAVPAWLWLGGGLLGALFVTASLQFAPRLGATFWMVLVVAGQMAGSLAVDHFAWLGFAPQPITATRLAGVTLVLLGVVLLARH